MKQIMGKIPPEHLMPSPPLTSVMVDYFGLYLVQGEVQKHITGKAWEVIFRAVHIEIVFGYGRPTCLSTDWSKNGIGFIQQQKTYSCDIHDAPYAA